ncbi:PH domain-containing protein [Alteribacillus sp. HJP-4]|uniref:PH domain-containing protein n=1 Tax=Alteribacillus sp. HJP-4 TaxID=2775394 RepID=UPI0035CCE15B
MRQPPNNMIAEDAVKAWRITAAIYMIIPWALTVLVWVGVNIFEFSNWYGGTAAAVSAVFTYFMVFPLPQLRWKRWRYQVFDQEIYIQHGILIVTRILVPMIRVQHVDTKQGPILKKYGLASLTVSTAATTHEIPALREEEAADLRDQISVLARVEQDDV